jgi:carbon storage regulator
MLVLARKEGDKVFIGDNIEITVVKLRGDVVRIGIKAPQDVRVLRSELNEKGLKNGSDC